MNPYVAVRKVIQGVVLLLVVAVLIFVIFRLMPGNPALLLIRSTGNTHISYTEKQALLASFGLQYGKWSYQDFTTFMFDMFTGTWGYDYLNFQTVSQIVFTAMPYTLLLIGTAAVLGWIIGIPLGITTTRLRGKRSESIILTTGLVVSSIPYLVLAIMLFLYLVASWHVFPVGSYFSFTKLEQFSLQNYFEVFRAIALPLVSLFLIGAAGHMITMRATMVSILGEDFITTARAKGVPERQILRKHAARNAMIPISTRMALELALIVSGAVLVDIIYSYPGIGLKLYNATLNEDYPLIEAATFMISVITILAYLMVDYIHAWLDPRISV